MDTGRDICFEAVVLPGLVALLAEGRRDRQQPAPPVSEPAAEEPVLTCPDEELAEAEVPAWPRLSLRRDGRRPLSFAGLPVLCAETETTDPQAPSRRAWRCFRLFLTQDRRIVAHLAVIPDETVPARPIHRADFLNEPEDLDRFLSENDPSDCASVAPLLAAAHDLDRLWTGLRLALPLSPGHCAGSAPQSEGRTP